MATYDPNSKPSNVGPFDAENGYDMNDGVTPTRYPFSMGGNVDKMCEPYYGMDGAGNSTLTNLDEREVLSDTVSATYVCFDEQNSESEWSGNRQGVYKHR